MGEAVDQAQKQRELSKEALAADLDRLEAKVRSELDVRSRLRRDGPRVLALAGAAILLVGAIVLLRSRLRRRPDVDEDPAISLEEVAAELREIRRTLERQGKGTSSSLAQKALLRGLSAAGAAGGTYFARRMLSRQPSAGDGGKAGASAG
ncbi:MAG TPA: hypothetical protein VNY76_02030 [Candidatus Acidoferrales bacterium]|nr:hypothetical protein [Candidatus Acidoferrales bacterium]